MPMAQSLFSPSYKDRRIVRSKGYDHGGHSIKMSRSSTIRTATATFLALTWVTLFVRCWVRIKLVKVFGIDDKWMIAAQVRMTDQHEKICSNEYRCFIPSSA